MLLSMESWRFIRRIEENFQVGERFTWEEMRKIAPPCAITPSRSELSLKLVRELIRAGRLSATQTKLKQAEFILND